MDSAKAIPRRQRSPFYNTIGGRVILIIGVLGLTVTVLADLSAWRADVSRSRQETVQNSFDVALKTEEANSDWLLANVIADRYIDTKDPALLQLIADAHADFDEHMADAIHAEALIGDLPHAAELAEIRDGFIPLWAKVDLLIQEVKAQDVDAAEHTLGEIHNASQAIGEKFQNLTGDERAELIEGNEAASASAQTLFWILIAAIVSTIIFSVLGVVWIIRSTVRPLSQLRNTARAIGEGDVTIRAEESGPREVRDLASVLNLMAESVGQREGALRVSEAYWQSLIQNAQDVIAVVNADDLRIRYISPAITRMLGYNPADLQGRLTIELIHPDDVEAIRAWDSTVRNSPDQAGSSEFRMLHVNGGWVHVEGRAKLVHDRNGDFLVVNKRRHRAQAGCQDDYPHGLSRRPNRPAQPPPLRGPPGRGTGPGAPQRGQGLHAGHGPGPLQDHQRHARPRRWR